VKKNGGSLGVKQTDLMLGEGVSKQKDVFWIWEIQRWGGGGKLYGREMAAGRPKNIKKTQRNSKHHTNRTQRKKNSAHYIRKRSLTLGHGEKGKSEEKNNSQVEEVGSYIFKKANFFGPGISGGEDIEKDLCNVLGRIEQGFKRGKKGAKCRGRGGRKKAQNTNKKGGGEARKKKGAAEPLEGEDGREILHTQKKRGKQREHGKLRGKTPARVLGQYQGNSLKAVKYRQFGPGPKREKKKIKKGGNREKCGHWEEKLWRRLR